MLVVSSYAQTLRPGFGILQDLEILAPDVMIIS